MRRMTGGVRFFAMVGEGFLTVYDPQRRSSRTRFAREALLWALLGAAGWFALFPMLARRFHDVGMSGAWSGLALIPCVTPILILGLLMLPARPAGRAWPPAEAPFFA